MKPFLLLSPVLLSLAAVPAQEGILSDTVPDIKRKPVQPSKLVLLVDYVDFSDGG